MPSCARSESHVDAVAILALEAHEFNALSGYAQPLLSHIHVARKAACRHDDRFRVNANNAVGFLGVDAFDGSVVDNDVYSGGFQPEIKIVQGLSVLP